MWKRGQIPGYQLPTDTMIIDPPELRSTPERTVAVYARVSRSENKKNLDPQAERLTSWCNAASAGLSPKWSRSVAAVSTISAHQTLLVM
jgi:predicted site-specific integrase-resolvase